MSHEYEHELIEAIRQDYGPSETEQNALNCKLIELGLIPFDVTQSFSGELIVFGFLGDGPRIGKYVSINDPPPLEEYDFNNWVGLIIGDHHGRVVVAIENLFYGWLDDAQYEFVNNFVESDDFTVH